MNEATSQTMSQSLSQSISDSITALLNTPYSVIRNEVLYIFDNLHFLRADWFYAFIPLIIYLILYSNKTQNNKNWQSVIDQTLLPFVLTKSNNRKRRRYPLLLIFIAGSLCITALAGPVYKKLPQPVYREQSSLVVLLDMSASMNATDIKPSRLSRAKLKLLDILKTRKTGQTALIVYAADAFVVTPLTDDNATIANLIPALETEMMPAQGSNLSLALAKTFSLFSQAGIIKGDVLVITDDIHEKYESAIKKVSSQGHRLSIIGAGTTEGGPIPLLNSASGGFLLDKQGAIVIPKLQPIKLQRYALTGSGLYTDLKTGDNDVYRLTELFLSKDIAETDRQDTSADIWQEEGPWLLLPLLLFAALWTRKGWIAVLIPFTVTLFAVTPQPAYAETENLATNTVATSNKTEQPFLDTNNLWTSPDLKAMKAFNAGDNQTAAEHFTQADWKASALYRNGDYQGAVKTLENTDTSDGFYNKANALAKLGQYQEAIKAYDNALEREPDNDDAKYNREQVKQALQKQQQSQQDDSEQNSDKKDQDQSQQENKDKSESSDQDEDNQDGDDKDGDKQEQEDDSSSEQKDTSGQNQPQTDADQQKAEEQELKQRNAEQEKNQQQQEQQEYEQQQEEKQDRQQQSDSVENKDNEDDSAKDDPLEIEVNPMEASITEDEKATEQWLKRIPDDPGGLLRRKFLYQYKRIPNQTDSEEPW